MDAPFRPVSNVDQQVIFRHYTISIFFLRILSAPYRKTQVIANQQVDLPAFYSSDQPLLACCIMFVFTRISKEVTLIIIAILPIRQHPDKPVIIVPLLLNNE